MKVITRKLEKQYRSHPSATSKAAWRLQFSKQRVLYQKKFISHWRFVVESTAGNSRSMWSKMRCLLQVPSDEGSCCEHSADDFADYFARKIDTIRRSTSTATPPVITTRPVTSELNAFHPVTTMEVSQLSITMEVSQHL